MNVNTDANLAAADHAGIYSPTPAEIRAACLEIQRGWTRVEEMKRRGVSEYDHVDYGRPVRIHAE